MSKVTLTNDGSHYQNQKTLKNKFMKFSSSKLKKSKETRKLLSKIGQLSD